jgi:hypothetical protein
MHLILVYKMDLLRGRGIMEQLAALSFPTRRQSANDRPLSGEFAVGSKPEVMPEAEPALTGNFVSGRT